MVSRSTKRNINVNITTMDQKPNILLVVERIDKDDEFFSFIHSRLIDLAASCQSMTIICLEERSHLLPPHVTIYSLGKEHHFSRPRYLFNFFKFIINARRDYDHVFVYLTPLYVVLGGPVWRLMGKHVVLWYNHTFVDWTLRVASLFTHAILTTSARRIGINSPKVKEVSGKVDVEAFMEYLTTR